MALTESEEAARRLAEAFGELTTVIRTNSEEEKRLAAEEREAAKAAERFKAKMDAATNTASALADAFITYNKEVYKGTSAAKASVAANEKMAEAAVAAAAGLAILSPGGPVMKALIAGIGLLAAKLIGLGNEVKLQTDDIYKALQTLAKAGATGAGGMQAVFDSLQKVGLGTEKFAEYLKLVTENSGDLALIGGTVRKGSEIFEKSMASLSEEQRITMERMVGDRTAQAEAVMGYVKQQRLLTLGTKAQMDMSSAAVMRYVKETDELTRIIGINRAEQEKLVEQAQRNEAFQASLNKIRREQGEDAYKQVLNAAKIARAAGEETFAEFTDSLSGFVGATDRAGNMFMASQGKSAEILAKFRNGEIKTTEQTVAAMRDLFGALGQSTVTFENQAEMMNFEASGLGKFFERMKAMTLAGTLTTEALADAQSELTKLLQDPATFNMAKAENDTRETQLRLQLELNKGMVTAIDTMAKTAEENRKIVDQLGKLPMTGIQSAFEQLITVVGKLADLLRPFVENVLVKGISAVADTANKAIDGVSALISGKGLRGFDRAGGTRAAGRLTGMAGGAAIGSAVLPGVGTAIGAIGGYFAGDKFMQGYEQLTGTGPSQTAGSMLQQQTVGVQVTPEQAARATADFESNNLSKLGAGQVTGKTAGVHPKLLDALEKVAGEWGQPISINSGLRTREEQQKLYFDYLMGRSRFPTAEPGKSKHEKGNAVDIDRGLADALDRAGLLKKYGLSRPVAGDPVHITMSNLPGFENGGFLEAGKLGIAGEKGKPEIIQGPANITSNNDIMNAFNNMASLLERSLSVQEAIARATNNSANLNSQMLSYAQN